MFKRERMLGVEKFLDTGQVSTLKKEQILSLARAPLKQQAGSRTSRVDMVYRVIGHLLSRRVRHMSVGSTWEV